jgi:hypothetical protein
MSFSPVVSGSGLSEDEVVRPEDLTVGTGPDRVHGSGFEVDEDCPWDVLSSWGFVVVDVDALQLQVGVSVVGAGGVDAVLVRDDFPELLTKTNVSMSLKTVASGNFWKKMSKIWTIWTEHL